MKTSNIPAQVKAAFSEKIRIIADCLHKEYTQEYTSKKWHSPFASCYSGDITTCVELPKYVIKVLIDADVTEDNACNIFDQERIVKRTKKIFYPIKEFQLPTGLKSNKPKPKVSSIIKEEKETYGVILETNTNLSEDLKYPTTIVPLSI